MIIEKILALNLGFIETFGYLIIIFSLFIESLPFIGAFIPGGSILLFISGFLARLGFLNLWIVIVIGSIASVSIDNFGYWLGRMRGHAFFQRYRKYFFVKRNMVEKIGGVIHGHTGKALILGKFNPATRAIAPFLVGTKRVNFIKFFFYSVIGGVSWVVMLVVLGYLFGNSLKFAQTFERYILIGTILLAICFYGYYILSYFSNGKTKCELKNNGLDCKKQD